jgi:dTDP-4-dehydrorhamnose 3,5-epimerase
MNIIESGIKGLFIIEPKVFEDERGYFYESYNRRVLNDLGIKTEFVQDNQSKSQYGVIRGLHYQQLPFAQIKLVRVLDGIIYDVALDLRKGSPTFGTYFGIELSSANKLQLYVPAGFAHGFSVLSETSTIMYKCNEFYNPQAEAGIVYNDRQLLIDWKIPDGNEIVSDKDVKLPSFEKAEHNFIFD